MSRPAREISSTGLYHIIFRGMNHQNIFEEESDYIKLLEITSKVKEEMKFEIYAYCLMTNHVHIFIKEKNEADIKKIMLKLLSTYVGWYNRKYLRNGSLIGNRYKSEPIENDKYVFALIKYIHNNPKKAGMEENLGTYEWSSYNDYLSNNNTITDSYFLLEMLSGNRETAKKLFIDQHEEETEKFSLSEGKKLTDDQIKRKIKKVLGSEDIAILSTKPKNERNEILRKLKEKERLTIREIERNTGISRGIILRS